MKNIGFQEKEISCVIDIVVAILNLGNVIFKEDHKPGVGPCAKITDETKRFAEEFGKLVGLNNNELVENLLTMKI